MAAATATPLTIRSAEDQVYEALRDKIVRGLPPLSQLRLVDIAAEFAVSTMPVRVALRRLEAENLVVTLPRRGSQVAPLLVTDIEEIQTMRMEIEGLAARLGAPNVDGAGLTRMRKHLTALRHAVAKKDIDAYVRHGREFEDICYEAAGWPRLLRLVQEMRRAAERYLRLAVAGGGEAVLTHQFWERFYDAIAEHDGPTAEAVQSEALQWTLDWIRAHLEETGPPVHS